ncbi:BspA family leucine-rich repeat surface protein [Maribacter sp. CXY002]|uniref:BspA family leucine-rich repeat surface protein n=1 Tax=Maribacter luteocoastalis TaxID=3407671 RepID=UPI003B684E1C
MLKKLPFILLLISLTGFSQSFISTWDTNNTSSGSSASNEITIPTNPAYTYNYNVDWGDGNINIAVNGDITHTYTTVGSYTISISGTFPAIYFNNSGDVEKIIEILSWGDIQWQTMENAFYGCSNLNFDAIDAPDLTQVTNLSNMFRECESFNGILNNWDVSTITNMSGLFRQARIFNRPLDNWNTISVTNMSETFYSAQAYNEPLDNWNTASVTNMSGMFLGAGSFNQNINNWDVSQVTNMSSTFQSTNNFNYPLHNWNVSNVTNMARMFNSSAFNQSIPNWDVSNVTSMAGMFGQGQFNQPLANWDVSAVTDMSTMFQRNRTFNQPLNSWDVSNVTNMSSMFDGYFWDQVYNFPLDSWDVSNVTNMSYMFRDNSAFNQDIGGWDVSSVTTMKGMFNEAQVFNQDISGWNVSAVTDMSEMFQQAPLYNQPLNSWAMGNVTNISAMFSRAEAFNQPLGSWNLSNVTNFQNLFNQTTAFNQDLSTWVTSSVSNMSNMFNLATAFNQNLGMWDISNVTVMTNMLSNSGISQENYDTILIGWSGQTVNSGITLGAINLQYCDGLTQRQSLIDNNGWNIIGDSVNCSYVLCTEITMPHASDTATPANSDIRWNPAPNATGYKITIRRVNGPIDQLVYNNYDVGNVVGVDFTNEFTPGDNVFVTVVPYNADGDATGCQEINYTVVESWVNSPNAFKLTYDTRLQNSTQTTPVDQLKIQTTSGFSYNYSIDWGDGQYDNNVTGDITHTYLIPGIYTVSIIGTFPAPRHEEFNSDAFKLLSIDQWGTQTWETMQGAFAGCENMEYNATDIPDLSLVTDMGRMFIVCRNFNGNINNWDVSNVTNMYGMFGVASIFNQPLDNWDVSSVTNMNFMFASTSEFNQNINSWDTGSVTNMARMFSSAKNFNQPLNNWDVSRVTDMSKMFERTDAFNQPINAWDVSNVQNMEEMFYYTKAFNQNIDNWNVLSVATMRSMFSNANVFDQPLNSWNVSSVTNMASMFNNANMFDQPLNNWNVSEVTNMSSMFSSADVFNQNIDSWNVTNVTNMSSMFNYAPVFNQPLNSWDVNSVVNMSSMFRGATSFNQALDNWDVSAVANMSNMFEDAIIFNQPLNTWNVSSVTLMPSMFEDAAAYAQEMNNWNVSVVTNFNAMFKNAAVFNSPLNAWDTGEAQNMAQMFYGATLFDQNLDNWNTSYVTTMQEMFREAESFNQSLDSWNVASVTTMQGMFQAATAFNGSINSWNVRGVATMQDMFNVAISYNQSLNNWRVNGVTNMNRMFQGASSLNQTFDAWNPGNVSMQAMFHDAIAFNQYLGDWNVSNVTNMQNMLDDTSLSLENYDNTLIAWSEQTLTPGINLGANSLPYCDAVEERQSIIDNFGWSITGDVLDCPFPNCTQLTAPLHGETNVPVNTNLTWEPQLYVREYKVSITIQPSGTVINETMVNNTTYEFTSDFMGGETVFVTITPSNDTGDAIGPCVEESFTISTNPATLPECTNLTEPLNSATNVAVTSDLSWDPISNADGYRLTIATTSGGNDILNNFDVGNVTTYDHPTNLPEDSDIFITIVPYNEQGDTNGCGEENFHTELIPVPPVCSNLISPVSGTTGVPIDTSLSWNAVDGATGYLVVVGITQGGIEVANNIDVGNTTSYAFSQNLQENRTHYVTIIPYNNEGDAVGCAEQSFRTGTTTLNSPPLCTNLSTPLNGETGIPVDTDLSWDAAANVEGYYLTVGTSSGATDILNGYDTGNVTTFNLPTNLPENTAIFVTITPYNSFGNAASCAEESFTTETMATVPNCTSLSAPINGASDISISSDISWNAISNADGYYLTVGTTSGGSNILNNQDVSNVTTYNLPNDLPEATTIYVMIVPYNSVGIATGCTEESFTTETVAMAPSCTSLAAPINGTSDISISTDISWNAMSNADGYYLTVGTTSGGSNILNNQDVSNVTTYNLPNDLPEATTIYVMIVPYNSVGIATGCTEESFTTETVAMAPSCTSLSAPINGVSEVSVSTDISWNAISNADGYYLTIGTTSGGTDILNNQDVHNVSAYNLSTDLPEATTIYVTIVPYNSVGIATGCTEESFTTETMATAPSCTSLSAPINGAIDISISTDISWNAISNADGYYLTVGTTSGGTDILNNQDVSNVSTYNLPNDLPEAATIYVTIVPYNSVGIASGCTEESFITETLLTIPDCTNLISPNSGDINVELTASLSWEASVHADGYRLSVGTTSGGNELIDNEDVSILTSYTFTENLLEGTTYFVTITPYNSLGDAVSCGEFIFTTVTQDDTLYGFSPNGDGINDFWSIDGIELHPENTVYIYNRWGDLVFQIQGYDNQSNVFSGTANKRTKLGASELPSGTYFFNIQVSGEHNLKKLQGFVVLKR